MGKGITPWGIFTNQSILPEYFPLTLVSRDIHQGIVCHCIRSGAGILRLRFGAYASRFLPFLVYESRNVKCLSAIYRFWSYIYPIVAMGMNSCLLVRTAICWGGDNVAFMGAVTVQTIHIYGDQHIGVFLTLGGVAD